MINVCMLSFIVLVNLALLALATYAWDIYNANDVLELGSLIIVADGCLGFVVDSTAITVMTLAVYKLSKIIATQTSLKQSQRMMQLHFVFIVAC